MKPDIFYEAATDLIHYGLHGGPGYESITELEARRLLDDCESDAAPCRTCWEHWGSLREYLDQLAWI